MHTFWRRWLAGQRCRCWREWAPGQIHVGRLSWGVITCFFCRFRWWVWSFDCQPFLWPCGPCVCQAAIAAACRCSRGATQCRRMLWGRQTQLRPSFSRKAILDVLCQQGDLQSTSRVKSPPAPKRAVGRWLGRHERIDESLEDFKGNTQQIYGTIALWLPQWLFWLRDRNY